MILLEYATIARAISIAPRPEIAAVGGIPKRQIEIAAIIEIRARVLLRSVSPAIPSNCLRATPIATTASAISRAPRPEIAAVGGIA